MSAQTQVTGAGASFPFAMYAKWFDEYSTLHPDVQLSRNLERVADLATNMAEDAVYLAEGKTIKHHLEDRPTSGPPVHV